MTELNSTEITAPRAGSKQAKLVGMLSRKSGVSLGWQTHTTRATLTGLKKRGYVIERVRRQDKDGLYLIKPDAA